jgi:hypothetical protein
MVCQQRIKRAVVRNPRGQTQFFRAAYVARGHEFRVFEVANHFDVALANAAAADHGKFG